MRAPSPSSRSLRTLPKTTGIGPISECRLSALDWLADASEYCTHWSSSLMIDLVLVNANN